jgi:hypothetical protein
MGGVEAITERSVTTLGNDCLVAWLYQVWGEIDHTYAISSGRGDRNLTQTIATVGAVTATASFRFAKWFDGWFTISRCNVIIGKAGMTGETYKRHFVPNNAIYLTTVGYGTGALLGRGIARCAGGAGRRSPEARLGRAIHPHQKPERVALVGLFIHQMSNFHRHEVFILPLAIGPRCPAAASSHASVPTFSVLPVYVRKTPAERDTLISPQSPLG